MGRVEGEQSQHSISERSAGITPDGPRDGLPVIQVTAVQYIDDTRQRLRFRGVGVRHLQVSMGQSSSSTSGQRRNAQVAIPDDRYLDFERRPTDQVPNAGFHPVQPSKDHHGPLYPRGYPAAGLLQSGEHVIEPLAQVRHDMVVVKRGAMAGVVDGGGTADQHGIRHQLLEPCRRSEHRSHLRGFHRPPDAWNVRTIGGSMTR